MSRISIKLPIYAALVTGVLFQPLQAQGEESTLTTGGAVPATSIGSLSSDELLQKGGENYRLNTPEGVEQAVIYFHQSVEMGNAQAARALYLSYIRGRNIAKDAPKAHKWLHRAAALGHVRSAHDLGHMYQGGLNVPKNLDTAAEYFKQAALAGHPESKRDLALCFYFGHGVSKDQKIALRWMTEAAAGNVANAQYRLGIWLKNGIDGKKDRQEAQEWFAKAIPLFKAKAKKGDKEAARTYAYMHDHGYGVDEDNKVAYDVYLKLANQDDPRAQYSLALLYLLGDGVEKDVASGKMWLERAHKLGSSAAEGILKRNGWL